MFGLEDAFLFVEKGFFLMVDGGLQEVSASRCLARNLGNQCKCMGAITYLDGIKDAKVASGRTACSNGNRSQVGLGLAKR